MDASHLDGCEPAKWLSAKQITWSQPNVWEPAKWLRSRQMVILGIQLTEENIVNIYE